MPEVRLPDGRIIRFPYDMSPSQIETEVAKLVQPTSAPSTFVDEPTTYGEGVRKSLAETGTRFATGVGRTLAAPFRAAADPIGTLAGIGEEVEKGFPSTRQMIAEVARGDPEAGGEAIASLLLPGAASKLIRGVRRVAPVASDVARTAGRTVVSREMPITGPMLKEWDRTRRARAFREVDAPENIARGRQAVFDVSRQRGARTPVSVDDLLDVMRELERTELPESIGGPTQPLRARGNRPVLEPSTQRGMITTQPDKWGMQATFPEADIDLALRPTQSFGPLRSGSAVEDIVDLTEASRGIPTRPDLAARATERFGRAFRSEGGAIPSGPARRFAPQPIEDIRPVASHVGPEIRGLPGRITPEMDAAFQRYVSREPRSPEQQRLLQELVQQERRPITNPRQLLEDSPYELGELLRSLSRGGR